MFSSFFSTSSNKVLKVLCLFAKLLSCLEKGNGYRRLMKGLKELCLIIVYEYICMLKKCICVNMYLLEER